MAVKPKLKRADRRRAIVDAAIRLFADRGFRGVTTRELARSVGVTEPVLYEHFRTKTDLYSAIIECASQEGVEHALKLLKSWAQTEDSRGFFLKLANLIVDYHTKYPEYFRLVLFSALEGHEMADLCFERNSAPMHALVIDYVKKQAAAGEFRRIDPPLAARAFLGMVMQYCLFDLHFRFRVVRVSRKRALEGMVDIFLNGLKQ